MFSVRLQLQVVLLSTVVLGGITGPLLKMVLSRAVHPPAMPGRGLVANDSMTSLSQGLFPGNGTAFTVSAPSSPHRRQDEEADSQHGGNYNAGVGYPNLELSSYPDQSVEDRERLYSSPLRSDGARSAAVCCMVWPRVLQPCVHFVTFIYVLADSLQQSAMYRPVAAFAAEVPLQWMHFGY